MTTRTQRLRREFRDAARMADNAARLLADRALDPYPIPLEAIARYRDARDAQTRAWDAYSEARDNV